MRLLPALLVLITTLSLATGCKKEEPTSEGLSSLHVTAPSGPGSETSPDDAEELTQARESQHSADALLQEGQPSVKVDEALVERFLEYRKLVVARSRSAVEQFAKETRAAGGATAAAAKANQTVAMRAARASQQFAERMRDIEDKAREELKLSRDEVAAVAQVVGAVLSQREIWRLSGGDEAVQLAQTQLAAMSEAERARGGKALQASLDGFAQMRDAKEARRVHGDAAVDAVLAHEEALSSVQREATSVMSQVY